MMSQHDQDQPFADVLGQEQDPALLRLATTLDRTYKDTPPPYLDAAIRHALHERTARPRLQVISTRRPRMLRWSRQRLAALGAALLLALSGMTGYLRLSGPTPVSAQTVLHRAAAAIHLAPNQVAHFSYSISTTGGYTGTGEAWIAADAGGALTLSAQTLTMVQNGAPALDLSTRLLQTGQQVYTYNPAANTVTIVASTGDDSGGVPTFVFDGTRVAQDLSLLAQRPQPGVTLLPQQTRDGHLVDVVEWDRGTNQRTTFYFDAQSYLLRGFDVVNGEGRTWQAQLTTYSTMPAAAVPPHTFTLNAPATARVMLQSIVPLLADLLPDACHVTQRALLIDAMNGLSPLAICQASNPSMTQAALVAALAMPGKAELDAAVTSGNITQGQEADSLAALQAQLTTAVTAPLPVKEPDGIWSVLVHHGQGRK